MGGAIVKINNYDHIKDKTSATHRLSQYFAAKGYKVHDVDNLKMIIVDKLRVFFKRADSSSLSCWGKQIADKKYLGDVFLKQIGAPITRGEVFSKGEKSRAIKWFRRLKRVVVKPSDGNQSRGVTVDINNVADFKVAWKKALETSKEKKVIVEEHFDGILGRYLVVNDKCIAVTEFTKPFVVGDGMSTVKELIEQKNTIRQKNPHLRNSKMNCHSYKELLDQNNYTLDSILSNGERLILEHKANPHVGSDTIDITDRVHPEFKKIAEIVVGNIPGLYISGLDILAKSHEYKPQQDNFVVIEINRKPGLGGHSFPLYGKPRDPIKMIADYIINDAKSKKKAPMSLSDSKVNAWQNNMRKLNSYKKKGYNATRLISQEFKHKGFKTRIIDRKLITKVNGHLVVFRGLLSSNFSLFARRVIKNKYWCRKFLIEDGLNVPQGKAFSLKDKDRMLDYVMNLQQPVLMEHGKGREVVNCDNFNKVWMKVYKKSKNDDSKKVAIREIVQNKKIARYLIVDGQCVAVTQFIATIIKGDGVRTLKELITEKNNIRFSNPYLKRYTINVDNVKIDCNQVLSKNETINIDFGIDYKKQDTAGITNCVRHDLKKISERLSNLVYGMDIFAVDIFADSHFHSSDNDFVIEDLIVNPNLSVFQFPLYGDPVDIAKKVVDYAISWTERQETIPDSIFKANLWERLQSLIR